MLIFGIVYTFILGAIVGSFLNVVSLRYNTGRHLKGRSGCPSCKHPLAWFELIPILSFIFLKGHCTSCRSKISFQYPLIETLTGVLFAGIFIKINALLYFAPQIFVLTFLYYAVCFSLLVVILIYDWKHKIIPDGFVYAFGLIAAVHALFFFGSGWDLIAGPLVFLPFYFLWLVSAGKWIGFGDGKLALGIGWFLGIIDGISAIVLAFWIGAVVSLIAIATRKHISMKSEIPFAPFLILGFWLVFYFGWDVVGLHAIMSLTSFAQ